MCICGTEWLRKGQRANRAQRSSTEVHAENFINKRYGKVSLGARYKILGTNDTIVYCSGQIPAAGQFER